MEKSERGSVAGGRTHWRASKWKESRQERAPPPCRRQRPRAALRKERLTLEEQRRREKEAAAAAAAAEAAAKKARTTDPWKEVERRVSVYLCFYRLRVACTKGHGTQRRVAHPCFNLFALHRNVSGDLRKLTRGEFLPKGIVKRAVESRLSCFMRSAPFLRVDGWAKEPRAHASPLVAVP
jgi:hypothetical protein